MLLGERFWPKVDKTDSCWNWIAGLNKAKYGCFRLNGKMKYVHRLSYELFNGVIPKELQIDHLCRNRKCVNPTHLEAVTSRDNTMRGVGITAVNSKKTCCNHGHEFTISNTHFQKNGRRKCRECSKRLCREYRERIKND